MDAELAYLFRHGLIRDAAYELQTPGARAALHGLALRLIEGLYGGPATMPDPAGTMSVHPTDPIADELALHAQRASEAEPGQFLSDHVKYTWRAAAFAEHRHDTRRSLAFYRTMATHPAASLEIQLFCARCEAWLLHTTGHAQQGQVALETALQSALGAGILREASRIQTVLGQLLNEQGQTKAAREMLKSALAYQRSAGLRAEESRTLTYLANNTQKAGKPAEAEAMYREALSVARAVEDLRGEGVALANLGTVLERMDRYEEAEDVYRRALDLQRRIGNRRIEGVILGNLAGLLKDRGDLAGAEQMFLDALAIQRAYGNRRSEGFLLGNFAAVLAARNRIAEADECYRQALSIHAQMGARWSLAVHRCDYALFKLRNGDADGARELWLQGADSLREIGDTGELGRKASEMRSACDACAVAPFADT